MSGTLAATTTPAVHSELGASSYKRWKTCPGSVALSRGVEKKSSVYADEGTRAHELAETILKSSPGDAIPYQQREMFDAVAIYVGHVELLRAQLPTFEWIEAKLNLQAYHPKLFGTGDYVCYFGDTKTLHVVDYKHGAGVAVEIKDHEGHGNVQLLYYAVGALHLAKVPVEKVVITIVQPRCPHPDGPIRTLEVDTITCLEFLADLVEDAIKTEMPDAALKPSAECRWCPAVGFCPALKDRAITAAKSVFTPLQTYDVQELSTTLDKLEQVEAWTKGVREFAYREAEKGVEIPGYKLVEKRATRKWREDIDARMISDTVGIFSSELFNPPTLISPAQLEKIVGKSAALDTLTVKESSGKKLVPISDDRTPTAPKIRDVFNVIEGDIE